MDQTLDLPDDMGQDESCHLRNVADNLQLVADLGYADVALAVRSRDGHLTVVADARPMTAVAAVASTRVGRVLTPEEEPEAYEALTSGRLAGGARRRTTRGISYTTSAYPLGGDVPYGVTLRDLTQQVSDAPGKMERVFMGLAEDLLLRLGGGPLVDVRSGAPFATERRAGDGVLRIGRDGAVDYASPNAVNILRLAGVEGTVMGAPVAGLPGAAEGIMPALRAGAIGVDAEVGGRVLRYRTVSLGDGALVLIEDRTEARRREQEIKVKEATIREVHHRVKNNLQTIASLLRIQERRTDNDEAARALHEAVERISSMAVVHEMLSGSTEERVDFEEVARTVVDMVRQGLAAPDAGIGVEVEGTTGEVPASAATSLALVTAELVHNAIEHAFKGRDGGTVSVLMRRLPHELHLVVRDDGVGLPPGFDLATSANLGLAIVRTVVEDDLRGTLDLGRGRGTTVTIRVPLESIEGKAD